MRFVQNLRRGHYELANRVHSVMNFAGMNFAGRVAQEYAAAAHSDADPGSVAAEPPAPRPMGGDPGPEPTVDRI